MQKSKSIVSVTSEELKARRARGESKTDVVRVRAKTDEELEQDIASDPDLRNIPKNWHEAAEAIMPGTKQLMSLRLDSGVIEWFRSQGPGYQTRMNAVLRAFVAQQAKR